MGVECCGSAIYYGAIYGYFCLALLGLIALLAT